MKYPVLWACILLCCLFCGCATSTVKTNRSTTLSLKSKKDVYKPGETLELTVTVDTSQAKIRIQDGFYLTHWTSRIHSSGGEGWAVEEDEDDGSTFGFSKPIDKWSSTPFVVLEFEVLDLYETDVYGLFYGEGSPDASLSKVISISPGKSWHGTREVSGTMLKNFTKPGRYCFRATLNQPEQWKDGVKGISSQPIIIEIKKP